MVYEGWLIDVVGREGDERKQFFGEIMRGVLKEDYSNLNLTDLA